MTKNVVFQNAHYVNFTLKFRMRMISKMIIMMMMIIIKMMMI